MSYLDTPLIYNLFPRLAGRMDRWPAHAERAAALGFNWLYLNPIQYPGFSGSLYAIKDYFRLNPAFLPAGSADDRLEAIVPTLGAMAELGLHPMVDLVINHTARDSELVQEHPTWYLRDPHGNVQSPFAIDPADARKITVWGDLAEIDNAASPDRATLWAHWARLVERLLELGFEGFRCDAAYKVPAALWRSLVERARQVKPTARFFAETLGCTLEQTRALRDSGLHFFFNSSRWWDFHAEWCLEQHREFEAIPSISFPESHDTERLAAASGGSAAVQRQRYAFAAVFSAGLMLPIGYEFGFRKKLDVVATRPEDWEQPSFDLRAFIARVNQLKRETPLLQGEGKLQALTPLSWEVLVLERRSEQAPGQVGWIVLNKHAGEPRTLDLPGVCGELGGARLVRVCRDQAPSHGEAVPQTLTLDPAELVLVLAGGT
ncbi:MAG: alpha-amylase [Chloroflexi bacterium]|nr:alpha-amylase [Chloroflexota bacterium]